MSSSRSPRRCSKKGVLNTPPKGDTPESDEIDLPSTTHTCTANISPLSSLPSPTDEPTTGAPSIASHEQQADFHFKVSKDENGKNEIWELGLDSLPSDVRTTCLQAASDIVYRVSVSSRDYEGLTGRQRAILCVALATAAEPLLGLTDKEKLDLIKSFTLEIGVYAIEWLEEPYGHTAVRTKRALPILRIPDLNDFDISLDLVSTISSRFYFIEAAKPSLLTLPRLLADQLALQIQKSRTMAGVDNYTIQPGCRCPLAFRGLRTTAVEGYWVFFDNPKPRKDAADSSNDSNLNIKITATDSGIEEPFTLAKISHRF